MNHVKEYYRETQCITRQADRVKNLHDRYNTRVNDLTRHLQTFFKLFTRSDELITIIADYCQKLTGDVQAVQAAYEKHKEAIEQINTQLLQSNMILTAITEILHSIQESARSFISAAQTLASLAKNTEIKAHHAQKEGRGLAIIAQECLHLAQQAQLPFENFHAHIQKLEEIAAPVIGEVKSILELSERSQALLSHSFRSLENLDGTITSLQRIATRLEEPSTLSSQLREKIAEGIDILKNQLSSSTDIIGDISIRSERLNALARTLMNLHTAPSAQGAVSDQFTLSVRESIQALDTYPSYIESPISEPQILKNVKTISKRINELGSSMSDLMKYKNELDRGTKDVIQLRTHVEQFLTETHTTSHHLVQFASNLDEEIRTIEVLISKTSSLFMKIKTLSVYAKIEDARSVHYQHIIAPIVSDYAHLEQQTEKAFSNLTPLIVQLKLHTQRLRSAQKIPRLEIIKQPDYSKVKLFLDDMMRVFEEKTKLVREIVQKAEKLHADSVLFREAWRDYETVCSRTANMSTRLGDILKGIETEALAATRKKQNSHGEK